MSGVSPGHSCHDLLPCRGIKGQRLAGALATSLKEIPTPSCQNITNNVSSLRVPGYHQTRIGTSFVVCGDLRDAVCHAFDDRTAIRRLDGIVEEDVFVVAVLETVTDRINEFALSSGVWLVIAFGKEDVCFGAGGFRTWRMRPDWRPKSECDSKQSKRESQEMHGDNE